MATSSFSSLDFDQSFLSSLPLNNSPFLEQPFPSFQFRHHRKNSSSSCSHLATLDHAEVKDVLRVSLNRSNASLVHLKKSYDLSCQSFTESYLLYGRQDHHEDSIITVREERDGISSEDDTSMSSTSSSSPAFSNTSPSPWRSQRSRYRYNRQKMAQYGSRNIATQCIKPRLLFHRSLSTIKQSSSSTRSSSESIKHCTQSPSPSPSYLASPFRPMSKRQDFSQHNEDHWTCDLDVAGVINSVGYKSPSISSHSPSRDDPPKRRSKTFDKSKGILKLPTTPNNDHSGDTISLHSNTLPFCGITLPFTRRHHPHHPHHPSTSTMSSPSLRSMSSESSPIVFHRSPSVSFADLVSITSALLATPSPLITSP